MLGMYVAAALNVSQSYLVLIFAISFLIGYKAFKYVRDVLCQISQQLKSQNVFLRRVVLTYV